MNEVDLFVENAINSSESFDINTKIVLISGFNPIKNNVFKFNGVCYRWHTNGLSHFRFMWRNELKPIENTIMHDFILKASYCCRFDDGVFIVWEHGSDLLRL